jgi:hypothetical protein
MGSVSLTGCFLVTPRSERVSKLLARLNEHEACMR